MTSMLVWGAAAAWPCGGLSTREYELASAEASEIVLEQTGEAEIEVTYAVRYQGDAVDLGWVIPVPGDVEEVADGDPDRIDLLRSLTQPLVYVDEGSASDGGGCGCIGSGGAEDGGSNELRLGDDGTTLVVAQGFTGTYEYVVLAGGDAAGVQAWLEANGWSGIAQDALDPYADAGMSFVAVRVVPDDAETPAEGRLLPPVQITYGNALAALWPAAMLQYGSAPEQRTTVYLLGQARAAMATTGWGIEDDNDLEGTTADAPEALWDAHLRALGAERRFARTSATWADDLPGAPFVTRFDTIAPREVHTVDAVFGFEQDATTMSSSIVLSDAPSSTAAFVFLPLLGLGAWVRRRS